MEPFINEVLKHENDYIRILLNDYLSQSLEACKKAEEHTRLSMQMIQKFLNKEPIDDKIVIKEIPFEPLPASPKDDIMIWFGETFKPYSIFVHIDKDNNLDDLKKTYNEVGFIILLNTYFNQFNWLSPIKNVRIENNVFDIQFYSEDYKLQAFEYVNNKKELLGNKVNFVLKFDLDLFLQECNKKQLTFLYNLQTLNDVDCISYDTFSFSTLFSILEIMSKHSIVNYEMTFNTLKVFSETFELDFMHTKKFMSVEESFKLKKKFEEIGILFL